MFSVLLLSLVNLFGCVVSQTVSSTYGPYFFPNASLKIIDMRFGGLDGDTRLWMNIEVDGDYWFGIGFKDSGVIPGKMDGTDAWIYGDYGDGYPGDIFEWNLGDGTIGEQDRSDNLQNIALNTVQQFHSIHVERDLDTGDRTDYVVTLSGNLCFIWAIGLHYDITTGHGTARRGEQCIALGGTTQAPSPAPTWWPTPQPTPAPFTLSPTQPGDTLPPSVSPTIKPTESPTLTQSPTLSTITPTGATITPTKSPIKGTESVQSDEPSISPTLQPTITSADAENNDSSQDNIPLWLLIVLVILGIVCLCCSIIGTLYMDHKRKKAREEKLDAKAKNIEEVEAFKATHGLNKPIPKSYDYADEASVTETEVSENVSSFESEEKNDYLKVNISDDDKDVDYNRIQSHSSFPQTPDTTNGEIENNNDDITPYINTNETQEIDTNKNKKKQRNRSRGRNKNKKQNRRHKSRGSSRNRKKRNNKSKRKLRNNNRNNRNNENDIINNDEIDDRQRYKLKLQELKRERMKKRGQSNKFQKNKKRGKFGGNDF